MTPGKLTSDRRLIRSLGEFASFYGMSEQQERQLIDTVQQLPVKVDALQAVLRVTLIQGSGSMQVGLELAELDGRNVSLMLAKMVEAPDITQLRGHLRKAGGLLLVQQDQGTRPAPTLVAAASDARVGRDLLVDIRALEDPEYDVVDWAWCLAEAPLKADAAQTPRRWRRNERQIKFRPQAEGKYVFRLWAAEPLRGESEPDCAGEAGVVAADLNINVGPRYRWTMFGAGSYDVSFASSQSMGMVSGRIGGDYRIFRRFGARAAFDVFQRMAGSKDLPGDAGWLGAATFGPCYTFSFGEDAALVAHLSAYWQDHDSRAPAHRGLGLGGDVRLRVLGSVFAQFSLEAFQVKDPAYARDPWMSRVRLAFGPAISF